MFSQRSKLLSQGGRAFATSVAGGVPVWRRYVVELTFKLLRILSQYAASTASVDPRRNALGPLSIVRSARWPYRCARERVR
jgi:hypothetical protein